MNYIDNKFRNLKKEVGSISLEVAICSLLFIVCVAGFTDLTVILRKINTISVQSNYIARTVGRQGGIRNSCPDGYVAEDYVTSDQLYQNIKKSFDMSGITEGEWSIEICGRDFKQNTNLPIKTYGDDIPITVSVEYDWALLSNFIPGTISQHKDSNRIIVSSFKQRDGDIKSEYAK